MSMLGKWTEILPLFVIRWLALRYCERVPFGRESNARIAAVARPGVLVLARAQKAPPATDLYVAVGGTRFSDGEIQTQATLAAEMRKSMLATADRAIAAARER